MAIERLDNLSDWHLVHDDQDIRGWELQDRTGRRLGTIRHLIVDTDAELVSAVVLDNGAEYAAEQIEIGKNVVYLRTEAVATPEVDEVVKVYDNTYAWQRSEAIGPYENYQDAYRTHYTSTYGAQGGTFEDYEPAYRTGYGYGAARRYEGKNFSDVEAEMRKTYEEKHGEGSYDKHRDALRHGFDRTRTRQ